MSPVLRSFVNLLHQHCMGVDRVVGSMSDISQVAVRLLVAGVKWVFNIVRPAVIRRVDLPVALLHHQTRKF